MRNTDSRCDARELFNGRVDCDIGIGPGYRRQFELSTKTGARFRKPQPPEAYLFNHSMTQYRLAVRGAHVQ